MDDPELTLYQDNLIFLGIRYFNNRNDFVTSYELKIKTSEYQLTAIDSPDASYDNQIIGILNKMISND